MPQADKAFSTPDCPVERLAREWVALYVESDRLAAQAGPLTPRHRAPLDQRIRAQHARREDIEAQVSWMAPQSATGAVFQLMLLHSDIDIYYEEATDRMHGRGRRLAYGILGFLQRAGAETSSVGAAVLMPEDLDPHRAVAVA